MLTREYSHHCNLELTWQSRFWKRGYKFLFLYFEGTNFPVPKTTYCLNTVALILWVFRILFIKSIKILGHLAKLATVSKTFSSFGCFAATYTLFSHRWRKIVFKIPGKSKIQKSRCLVLQYFKHYGVKFVSDWINLRNCWWKYRRNSIENSRIRETY